MRATWMASIRVSAYHGVDMTVRGVWWWEPHSGAEEGGADEGGIEESCLWVDFGSSR